MAQILPADWLRARRKPVFLPGHNLIPLSRYGWNGSMSVESRIELALRWGYALSLGQEVTPELVARLDDPQSDEARIVAASKALKIPLEVILSYRMPVLGEVPIEAWVRNAAGQPLNLIGEVAASSATDTKPVLSPIAPDSVWELAGSYRAEPLAVLMSKGVEISIVLDGGERGIPVWGWGQYTWPQDPAVVAAKNASGLPWLEYNSERKAHAEEIILNAVKRTIGKPFVFAHFGGDEGPLRNTWLLTPPYTIDNSGGWLRADMKRWITYPGTTIYYNLFNTGFPRGTVDCLTQLTNSAGLNVPAGEPLSYGWLNPGDSQVGFADFSLWEGFLKCWYVTGMLGHCFCYWDYPAGGFNVPFEETNPPSWLVHQAIGGKVQGIFSQLAKFMRDSDLLVGDGNHVVSTSDPSYEFVTGDSGVRVLARKHKILPEWLVVAWAWEGNQRNVTVSIPGIGATTVRAVPSGGLYLIKP